MIYRKNNPYIIPVIKMEFKNILDCKTKEEFKQWLENNHEKKKNVGFFCKKGKIKEEDVFYYIDAVYIALSWMD